MSISSSIVAANDQALATQYNSVRLDILTHAADTLSDTGVADAYIVTCDNQITALATGQVVKFIAGHANTGASTLRFKNSLALDVTKNIKKSNGEDLIYGDIALNALIVCVYDGTQFVIQGSAGAKSIDRIFTANESISVNDRVSLIDGTANTVEKTIRHNYDNPPSSVSPGGTRTQYKNCKCDIDHSAVIYSDGTNWQAIIAEINRETLGLSFGTPVQLNTASTASTIWAKCTYMADNKIAFLYFTADKHLRIRVGTVSGTTITLGTESDLYTGTNIYGCSMALMSTDKLVVAYSDDTTGGGNSTIGIFDVTVSGTNCTNHIANKITKPNGYTTGNDPIDLVCLNSTIAMVIVSYQTATVLGWKVTFTGDVPADTATYTVGVSGVAEFVNATQTCTNAGNEQILITWYDSGPKYNARTLKVDGTLSSVLALSTTPDGFSNSPQYLGIVCIEVDSTSNNTSRSFISGSSGTLMEIITGGASCSFVSIRGIGSGDYSCITLIDSNRKKIVWINGTFSARAMSEYDNSNLYIGCALQTVTIGNSIAIRSIGIINGFAGLLIGKTYYQDFNSYTLTTIDTGIIIGTAISTTELDVNNSKKCLNISFYTNSKIKNTGAFTWRIYHNLGVVPSIIRASEGGNPNTGVSNNGQFGNGTYRNFIYSYSYGSALGAGRGDAALVNWGNWVVTVSQSTRFYTDFSISSPADIGSDAVFSLEFEA